MGNGLKMNFSATIVQENSTRANDNGFVDGDRMGIYVVSYSLSGGEQPGVLATYNNQASNVAATYSEESYVWNLASDIYWPDDVTPVDVYGYYPYKTTITDVNEYSFEVLADQSLAPEGEMSNYEASDFLWAKSTRVEPTEQRVELKYNHMMAGVKVVLKAGDGLTDTEIGKLPKTVGLENVVRTSSINLATGKVTATGSAEGFTILAAESDCNYRGVIVPQTVTAGTKVISVTLDGVSYHLTRSDKLVLQSGKMHNFTVTVNKRENGGDYSLSITDEEILPWENDQLSHSFETRSYVVVNCAEYGKLKEAIETAGLDYSTIEHLKINGQLNAEDFEFIRNSMSQLTALNLYGVKIKHIPVGVAWGYEYRDDYFPDNALEGMDFLCYLVLPQKLTEIGRSAFVGLNLRGTLSIPNSVTYIHEYCFWEMGDGVEVNIPTNLERIDERAFWNSKVKLDFNLPSTLKYIGDAVFWDATNVYGTFALPSGIESIGDHAFDGMGHDMDGDIEIPATIKTVGYSTFGNINFKNGTRLYFSEGLETIEDEAFYGLKIWNTVVFPKSLKEINNKSWGGGAGAGAFAYVQFKGGVQLPENLSFLGQGIFRGSSISGSITLPAGISSVRDNTYHGTQLSEVTIPSNYEEIRQEAFADCLELKTITIGKNVNYIGERAIANCPQLSTVICLAKTPPTASSAFADLEWDKVVLEVPESSLNLYRSADGWKKFQNITPHRELAINLPSIECLNSSMSVEGVLRSEGAWTVESCPSWCRVSQTSGTTLRTELTVTVDELAVGGSDRSGEIVFKLTDADYRVAIPVSQTNYEYTEGKEIVLQTASAGGNEIPVFIIGDGFSASEISSGQYLQLMREHMEHFFNIEPYRTYRDYFTVSTSLAISPNSGISSLSATKSTKFDTKVDQYGSYSCNQDKLRSFMRNTSSRFGNEMDRALVIFVVNDVNSRGSASVFDTDPAIAFCPLSDDGYPYDQRGMVQHYAGGIAFAKLGPEYISHYEFFKTCCCPNCRDYDTYINAKSYGWFNNISLTGKMNDVPWSHLIFNDNYSDIVDVYEGAYRHFRGAYRSENMSCMSTFIAYYNTISRETIVRRIMDLSGKEFKFNDFVAKDSRDGIVQ
jgi:hypothetical protein